MKTKSSLVFLVFVLLFNLNALALTRYVNVSNPTPASPYAVGPRRPSAETLMSNPPRSKRNFT
jgi:hypothetical protein